VKPLAKLSVTPEDFPFLGKVKAMNPQHSFLGWIFILEKSRFGTN
jgi:hypothetical protein